MRKLICITCFLLTCIIKFSFAQGYFQQEVNYIINVSLNDVNHSIAGDIRIEYINNSPDTLYYIYFHLWPNAYKNNKTAFAQQQLLLRSKNFFNANESQRGYIDSIDFCSGTIKLELRKTENEDIAMLILNNPLFPGDTIQLSTPFYVKIPDSFSRMGHIGQTYQITQWYPKPAVYDKYGWHYMPYLDMGEFYSEFGRYEVALTLPEDYVVAATGNLVTKQELEWLEDLSLYNSGKRSAEVKQRNTQKTKTIRYVENNIHDFAWFANRSFIVTSDTLLLHNSGKVVRCWSFATPENKSLWLQSVEYVKEAVDYYSECIGDYPYNNCTAVDGALSAGGGMEYPGITVISSGGDAYSLERVIFHEVGHNWFYGMLASNERQFPWIDEGFNSFYEYRFFDKKYPDKNFAEAYLGENMKISGMQFIPTDYELTLIYQYLKSFGLSQPAGMESTAFSPVNYWVMSYQKPVTALKHLEKYLTPQTFDKMMQDFFITWQFKHPYPEDIRQSFYKSTANSLSWFFDGLIDSDNILDYAIEKIENDSVRIANKGSIKAPLLLYVDDRLHIYDGFEGKQNFPVSPDAKEISIDRYCITTDFNKGNNYYQNNALFPKSERIKTMMTGFINIPAYRELNLLPALGYNTSQKLLMGIVAHNYTLSQKKIEWMLIPLFAPFKTENINSALGGSGRIAYNIIGENTFYRQISISETIKKYSFDVQISENDSTLNWLSAKTSATIWLQKNHIKPYQDSYFDLSFNLAGILTEKPDPFFNLSFNHSDDRVVNPYSFLVEAEKGPGYVKAWSEFNYTISYLKKNRGLHIRVFGGSFLYNSTQYYGNYNFRLSGDLSLQDYQFQEIYTSRGSDLRENSSSFWAHQFNRCGGGFVSYTPLGQTNKWIASVNIVANLPIPIIKVFFNAGTWSGISNFEKSGIFAWEAGVELEVIRHVFSIFVPVAVSGDIRSTNSIYFNNYFERVRFTLNLNLLNPYFYRHKISYLI